MDTVLLFITLAPSLTAVNIMCLVPLAAVAAAEAEAAVVATVLYYFHALKHFLKTVFALLLGWKVVL